MYLVNTKGERGKFTTRYKDPPPWLGVFPFMGISFYQLVFSAIYTLFSYRPGFFFFGSVCFYSIIVAVVSFWKFLIYYP